MAYQIHQVKKGDTIKAQTTIEQDTQIKLNEENIEALSNGKIAEPKSDGTNGQVLTTDGNGGRTWKTIAAADPAVIGEAVSDWLTDHPEATTTVADGSITEQKLASSVAQKVNAVTQLSDEIDDVKSAKYDKITKSESNVSRVSFFDNVGENPIESLTVSCKFSQSGSGTPSFGNVRPITGVSSVAVTYNSVITNVLLKVSGSETAVYDAVVDLVSGVATVYGVMDTFTGSSVNDFGTGTVNNYVRVPMSFLPKSGTWSKIVGNVAVPSNSSDVSGTFYQPSVSNKNIRIYDASFTSKDVAKSIMDATPVQMYYKVTPFSLQLDPTELKTIQGQNIITVGTGKFSIAYSLDFETVVQNSVSESNGLSTDATFYAEKVPTYYIEPASDPTSYAEAQGYLDDKIAQIPKQGKSFIFITDVHWDGNEKHSTDLINYIRKRTGIQKVLFGGDIYGNATSNYAAMKKAASYMDGAKRAFGYGFIPTVGDHDNNTVNVSDDAAHFLPYEQLEQLFVGDLERRPEYHFYDPSEKLANYATPGSDDYNGAMAFFHTVYYVDDNVQKIRYISLNCGCGGVYGSMYNIFGSAGTDLLRLQADWLVETLMSTPAYWDVIVLSHKANGSDSGTASTVINSIIYGFKRKNSNVYPHPSSAQLQNIDSWWPNTTSYNMSSAPDVGRVICFDGHTHVDRLSYFGRTNSTYSGSLTTLASGGTVIQPTVESGDTFTDLQIPVIHTATDSIGAAESGSPSMTQGTVTEQCFDVITLVNDGVVLTRIGAGDDRRFYITT